MRYWRKGYEDDGLLTLLEEREATLLRKVFLEEGKQDLVAYWIKYSPHRTCDKWFIDPTYNYSHYLCDSTENITFSMEVNKFSINNVRDLIPNGHDILIVTEETKLEYIRLMCQMKTTGAICKQLNAFLEGFYDVIPKRLISIFNEQELELLISGLL